MVNPPPLPKSLLPAVALISAAALGYEILLMRLLSIIHWHHFAYMVISLALLGYGVSGTLIARWRSALARWFIPCFVISAALFGVTMAGCFLLAQRLPFNALEVVWDQRQWLYLLALYLLFFLPFLFASTCIGMVFTCYRESITRIYLYDLFGAGSGALLVVLALFEWRPEVCLLALGLVALAGAGVVAMAASSGRLRWALGFLLVASLAAILALPAEWRTLRLSPYKGLNQTLAVMDTRLLFEHSSPLGLVSVVDSPGIPFRHAPGLSLASQAEPPPQLALFTDGDALSVINQYRGDSTSVVYLQESLGALPYRLLSAPRVLILGAGGGSDVLMAQALGARQIDAVELNPAVVALVRERFDDFAGGLYRQPQVRLHIAEARGYVARDDQVYDLIQLSMLDSLSAAGAGVQGLSESYLYTTEALQAYLARLAPGGILAINRWLKIPPRDGLKLFATAIDALRGSGERGAATRLALVRSWNSTLLLIKNGDWSEQQIDALRQFSDQYAFDLAYYPGISETEVNRYNRLQQPYYYQGALALLGPDAQAFYRNYKFQLKPATDDSPYFFHFFKWQSLPELLQLSRRGGAALLEWSYLILVATLVQALLAGCLLILWPLWRSHRLVPGGGGGVGLVRRGAYFLLLGLAFMFVEIAFIQKFVLFLSHPLYAIAVVLSGFLLFAGLGSGSAGYLSRVCLSRPRLPITLSVAGISIITVLYLLFLPALFAALIGNSEEMRILLTLLLIAPLAFCMGMPFPLGLSRLAGSAPGFIPWAWGLNGFASVVGAILATILAIDFGFNGVTLLALGLYLIAAFGLYRFL